MRQIFRIGECHKCGDDLYLYKSKKGSRFIKCDNPDCALSYPVPKYGQIEATFAYCPLSKIPILLISKNSSNIRYFWVNGPCFTCRKGSSCTPLIELREEYEMKTEISR